MRGESNKKPGQNLSGNFESCPLYASRRPVIESGAKWRPTFPTDEQIWKAHK
jgi:hypothetical protein